MRSSVLLLTSATKERKKGPRTSRKRKPFLSRRGGEHSFACRFLLAASIESAGRCSRGGRFRSGFRAASVSRWAGRRPGDERGSGAGAGAGRCCSSSDWRRHLPKKGREREFGDFPPSPFRRVGGQLSRRPSFILRSDFLLFQIFLLFSPPGERGFLKPTDPFLDGACLVLSLSESQHLRVSTNVGKDAGCRSFQRTVFFFFRCSTSDVCDDDDDDDDDGASIFSALCGRLEGFSLRFAMCYSRGTSTGTFERAVEWTRAGGLDIERAFDRKL